MTWTFINHLFHIVITATLVLSHVSSTGILQLNCIMSEVNKFWHGILFLQKHVIGLQFYSRSNDRTLRLSVYLLIVTSEVYVSVK